MAPSRNRLTIVVMVLMSSTGYLACSDDGAGAEGERTRSAVSGTVSGAVSADVAVALGGASVATTTTDAEGRFVFGGLAPGVYTVAPTRAGFEFVPALRSVTVTSSDVGGVDFASEVAQATSCDADFVVRDPQEFAVFAARACTTVRSLTLGGPDLTVVALPVLRTVTSGRVCSEMGCGGGLVVADCPRLTTVVLPALTEAGSLVVAGNPALTALVVPSLTTAPFETLPWHCDEPACGGGVRIVENTSLTSLSLPALAEASELVVSANASLAVLELPALETLADRLAVTGNPALPACQAEALLSQLVDFEGEATLSGNDPVATCPPVVVCEGDVTVRTAEELQIFAARGCTVLRGALDVGAAGFTTLDLPGLTSVQHLGIHRNPGLRTVNLPALRALTGTERCGIMARCYSGISVAGNPALERLELPALTTARDRVSVDGNAALSRLELPALTAMGSLSVTGNPSLAVLDLPRVLGITGVGVVPFRVSGNDVLPPCQPLAVLARLREAGYEGRADVSGDGRPLACRSLGLCPSALVTGPADWGALVDAGCREVAGDLTITASGHIRLDGELAVQRVDGDLRIVENDPLEQLSLAALARIDGGLTLSGNRTLERVDLSRLAVTGVYNEFFRNAALVSLELPSLTTAGYVPVHENPRLERLSLPSLTEVIALGVVTNDSLTEIQAPCLRTAAWWGINLEDNRALTTVVLTALLESGSENRVVGNASLPTLSLPSLARAWNVTVRNNPSLRSVELPALDEVGDAFATEQGLRFQENATLESVNLASLRTAGSTIHLTDNPRLERVSLPRLERATSIEVYGNGALTSVSAPALLELTANCGGLALGGPLLSGLELPALRSACQLSVFGSALGDLDFPSLESAQGLYVLENPRLLNLRAPVLTSLDILEVRDNPRLPACQARALADRVGVGTVRISGNSEAGTCTP